MRSIRFWLKRGWHRVLPAVPLPVRLPFGGLWLAWNDVCGDAVFAGAFEEAERRFLEGFLRSGMTVLDIGAHHGFYTLLASFKIGPSGRVIAFEPSPRERQKLLWHVRLNRCCNTRVEAFALGDHDGVTELFLVDGRDTGCNSLRMPNVGEPIRPLQVPVVRLDDYLRCYAVEQVDFVKMDVEGGELDVLKGAQVLLRRRPRPLWLVEAADSRTAPWGYGAVEIVMFMKELGYRWFAVAASGGVAPLVKEQGRFESNLIAVPDERMTQVKGLMEEAAGL